MVVNRKKFKIPIIIFLFIVILLVVMHPWVASASYSFSGVVDFSPHRWGAGAATAQSGKIYTFGGYGDSPASTQILEFDPSNTTISQVGTLSTNKAFNSAVTANNGIIYVFSTGFNGNRQNITKFYPDMKQTQELGDFYSTGEIIAKPGLALAPNGMIYMFGSNETGKIYKFDPNTDLLSIVGTMPNNGYSPSTATGLDGMIYIFGGCISSGYTSDIVMFNPSTNIATKIASLPNPNGKSCAALNPSNGKIYVIGGNGSGADGNNYNNIYEFDPATKIVSLVCHTYYPLADGAAAVSNGNIYVFDNNSGTEQGMFVSELFIGISPPQLSLTLQNNKDAVLTWSTVINSSSYIVEKSTDGVNFTKLAELTGATYTDANLPPGTYYYRVEAKNTSDTSPPSNVVSCTIEQPPAPPDSPVLSVTLDANNNANLSWTSVTGATNYILEKSTDGTNYSTLTQTSGTTYTDPNLAPGTYYYRVIATNDNGTSLPSNVVSVTVQAPEPPPRGPWVYWPTGGQYVEVDWVRGNVDLTGNMVQLWREDTVSGIWIPVKDISDAEKDSFTWLDTNVTSGLNYKYQIRVYDPSRWDWRIAIESDWAVQERPFLAPGGLKIISSTDTSATVTWTPVDGATSYQVQISTDGGNSWQSSTAGGPPVTVPKPSMVKIRAGTHARSQWSGVLTAQ